jgi:hypothetical protein
VVARRFANKLNGAAIKYILPLLFVMLQLLGYGSIICSMKRACLSVILMLTLVQVYAQDVEEEPVSSPVDQGTPTAAAANNALSRLDVGFQYTSQTGIDQATIDTILDTGAFETSITVGKLVTRHFAMSLEFTRAPTFVEESGGVTTDYAKSYMLSFHMPFAYPH